MVGMISIHRKVWWEAIKGIQAQSHKTVHVRLTEISRRLTKQPSPIRRVRRKEKLSDSIERMHQSGIREDKNKTLWNELGHPEKCAQWKASVKVGWWN